MAEETVQNNQETPEATDDKKGSKGLLLKIALIPVVIGVQALLAYYLVFNVFAQKPDKPKEEKKTKEVGQFFELKDIVVNPAGTMGHRFLVIELGFETHDPKLIEEAQSKEIWIRDAVISYMANKTPEDLLDIHLREQFKDEILKMVNTKLNHGNFETLYFTKYILQ